jgi:Putative restriction endonuclease
MEVVSEITLNPDKNYEIVNGHPEEKEVPGARHSGVCSRLARKLGTYVETNSHGEIYPEASFQIGESVPLSPNLIVLLLCRPVARSPVSPSLYHPFFPQ